MKDSKAKRTDAYARLRASAGIGKAIRFVETGNAPTSFIRDLFRDVYHVAYMDGRIEGARSIIGDVRKIVRKPRTGAPE